jgi:hypothetical protein
MSKEKLKISKKLYTAIKDAVNNSFDKSLNQLGYGFLIDNPPDTWSSGEREVFDLLNEFSCSVSASIDELLKKE